MNFLFTHADFISNKGIRFIMKTNNDEDFEGNANSGLQDSDLNALREISPNFFHHKKLDSYL